jgi:hypothetical protein
MLTTTTLLVMVKSQELTFSVPTPPMLGMPHAQKANARPSPPLPPAYARWLELSSCNTYIIHLIYTSL